MITVGRHIPAPDLAEAHASDALQLLKSRHRQPLTREDVEAAARDLRRAAEVLEVTAAAYPVSAAEAVGRRMRR